MCLLQTIVAQVFNNVAMDPDTFQLIRKLCAEFQLPPDIEFTCYDAYSIYFNRYYPDLEKRFKQTSNEYHGTRHTNQLIDQMLNEVEKTSLLHILALISICAKYINGFRCDKLITRFTNYLQLNGTPFNVQDIRATEYVVFKFLDFNIGPSELYATTYQLGSKIGSRNREIIRFERLNESCVTLLRFIYLHRKKCDEILHYVEQNTYSYSGNEDIKLAAASVYASAMHIYPQHGNIILNEIVHRSYLNESFLRKLGQLVLEFYEDCIRC